jgi:cytochrome bd-type quinol oxidase subunit 2
LQCILTAIPISDVEARVPPRGSGLIVLITLIGLILGIAGVSTAKDGNYKNGLTKAAMGIFLAVLVIFILMTVWLWIQLKNNLKQFQSKLFLAIALSLPFIIVRLVYSAINDYSNKQSFQLQGNHTIRLCMSVLEEIIAMSITMILATSAVLQKDFVKLSPDTAPKEDSV